jgi:hypothetical protein
MSPAAAVATVKNGASAARYAALSTAPAVAVRFLCVPSCAYRFVIVSQHHHSSSQDHQPAICVMAVVYIQGRPVSCGVTVRLTGHNRHSLPYGNGRVAYIGEMAGRQGWWIGVVLELERGENNGDPDFCPDRHATRAGAAPRHAHNRYFSCKVHCCVLTLTARFAFAESCRLSLSSAATARNLRLVNRPHDPPPSEVGRPVCLPASGSRE